MKAIVIGAGPTGLGAAYKLTKLGHEVKVFDSRESIGGLCSSFKVNGFTFDRFVHVSFAKGKEVLEIYKQSCPIRTFKPTMFNRYKDEWLAHPAQYNLGKLPLFDKVKIITSFLGRKKYEITDYQTYLYRNYGKAFADNFSIPYTYLYWQEDPKNMEVKWLNGRMYDLSFKQLLKGAMTKEDNIVYYASEFNYPDDGDGFGSFYKFFEDKLDIKFQTSVTNIDPKAKVVTLSTGEKVDYDILVSTAPLKELPNIMVINDDKVLQAIKALNHTSGYIVSMGLKKDPSYKDSMYFYNYNQDILSARVYFPHKKSAKNCPEDTYAMQIEIYTKNGKTLDTASAKFKHTISEILRYCNLTSSDVLFTDIRFEKYANILFDKDIYKNRETVLDYLKENHITSLGRFGEWEYLWSFQSLEHGVAIEVSL